MDWKTFLDDVSKTLFKSEDLLDELLNTTSTWLGFDGTSDDIIRMHEKRLGTLLPPSYKSFLKTSNGFKQLSCFAWDIWPVEKIDWLRNVDPELIEIWCSFDDEESVITDEEYFVYDKNQHLPFRSIYLKKCLAISGPGDATILLLNPEIKFGEEWEAWMFAPWNLGPTRYQSFEKLMVEEYTSYLELRSDEQ